MKLMLVANAVRGLGSGVGLMGCVNTGPMVKGSPSARSTLYTRFTREWSLFLSPTSVFSIVNQTVIVLSLQPMKPTLTCIRTQPVATRGRCYRRCPRDQAGPGGTQTPSRPEPQSLHPGRSRIWKNFPWNCFHDNGFTTLQFMMNAKLSPHGFRHCHENGLIKTIQTIPHNLYVSFKSASLYRGLG